MNLFDFILGCLATFRLSLLLSREDGPAFIFRKIRRMPDKGSSAKEGLKCPWCVSMWFAAVVTGFFWWRGMVEGVDFALYWLAFSAGSIIINQWTVAT